MSANTFVGYSGQVWSAVYGAVLYFSQAIGAASSVADQASLASAMLQTLLNGAEAINAAQTLQSWRSNYAQLSSILTFPLDLDSTTQTVVLARYNAYAGAIAALTPLIPTVASFQKSDVLVSADAVIPSAGYLNFCATFNYEVPPIGLTPANFTANALEVSTAFNNLANAIGVYQGSNPTGAVDTAQLESDSAAVVAMCLADNTSGPVAANLVEMNSWNQIVSRPTMNLVGSVIGNAPFTQQGQQNQVIRFSILGFAQQVARYLLILHQPQTSQINLTTVRNGETLMDIAARALGDFEQWQAIASLNGLFPPYIAPVSSPGVAAWGSQLILPAPGTQLSSVGAVPSYTINYLGTDFYTGPINGEMPPWSGDYELITGYRNLSWALGRRIQTTLASLIYHSTYGSRIPPEVGAVQDTTTVGAIAAYGMSALASDPRVIKVLSATASGSNGEVNFEGVVQPGGFGSLSTSVNEVISNVPNGAT